MSGIKTKSLLAILAIVAFLATGAFFMSNVVIPSEARFVSGINVILFAAPAFWATKMWLGRRDALLLFVVLGALALIVETLAIVTGFPYGHFGYSDLIGYRLFGYAPWTVALAWTPLVLAAYAVARRTINNAVFRIAAIASTLVVFDLVLDPGAVKLGFWRYEGGGLYYGVPLSNFLGWLFTGAIAAIVLEIFVVIKKPLLPAPVQLISSTFFIISFWAFIAFFSAMYLPLAIGLMVILLLVAFYYKYYYAFDEMIVMVDEENTPIAAARKLPAHNGDTKRHRAFSVFIFNGKGELLLQQRAATKKTWPGIWSNSCCGHPMLHEDDKNAARRRLKYELGLSIRELYMILPHFRYRAEKDGVVENEICPVMVGFSRAEPQPNPDEVNDVKWVDWKRFVIDVADPSNGFSPWARKEVELLDKEPSLQQLFAVQTEKIET